ncbi:hypothetical protein O9G_005411 [Rozella allomycis CSF55]|uniref:Aspartic peptidase domain-containing protein n=1 Tax=Rozella allomycis (strain CSF55) TaxID=988480 RepID=A0A075B2E7_ROZAC|nr:hypothetical protein O9G_005411 [Rozella allomycis CSF55]|eukprot:EPZ35101.1 hypothetical protein O9G_005411 [Rozella allomycis CSF55]
MKKLSNDERKAKKERIEFMFLLRKGWTQDLQFQEDNKEKGSKYFCFNEYFSFNDSRNLLYLSVQSDYFDNTKALVDTGASSVFMDESFARAHNVPIIKKEHMEKVETLNHAKVGTGMIKYISDVILCRLDNIVVPISFNIIESRNHPIILGIKAKKERIEFMFLLRKGWTQDLQLAHNVPIIKKEHMEKVETLNHTKVGTGMIKYTSDVILCRLDNIVVPISFNIIESRNHPIILGMSLLNGHKIFNCNMKNQRHDKRSQEDHKEKGSKYFCFNEYFSFNDSRNLLYLSVQSDYFDNTKALVDTGASSVFMDESFARAHNVPIIKKEHMEKVETLNHAKVGTGMIKYISDVILCRLDNIVVPISFNIIESRNHPIILGMSILSVLEPEINWKINQIQFNKRFNVESMKYTTEGKSIKYCSTKQDYVINLVSNILSDIPSKYIEFSEVFNEQRANVLPDHRSHDLEINLFEGSNPPFKCMYKCSKNEYDILKSYVKENMDIGFIEPSTANCGALVLFVKKRQFSKTMH